MTQVPATTAATLRSMMPKVVKTSTGIVDPQEAPRPLNQEAFKVILEYAMDKASQGFGGVMFFLDGIFEQYSQVEQPTRYYVETIILNMLKDPELGFEIEEEDLGDGTLVKLWWDKEKVCFSYIEVTPPEEYMPYLMSIRCGNASW